MFVELATLNGATVSISIPTIIRFRKSFGTVEPQNATKLDHAGDTFFSADRPDRVIEKLAGRMRLAALHVPNDLGIWLDATKVISILDADPAIHHPAARSVIRVAGFSQQVRESRAQAQTIVANALAGA